MPFNTLNPSIQLAFGTKIMHPSFSSSSNQIQLVRTHASDTSNRAGIIVLKIFIDDYGTKKIDNDALLWTLTAAEDPYPTLLEFMTANSLNYNVFVTGISNQANPFKELWAHNSVSSYEEPWANLTRAPLIAQNGVLIQGSTAESTAFYFDTTAKYLRVVEETFSGVINIMGVIQVMGTSYLLRDFASTTSYVMRFESGSTANIAAGHTINYIKKNGIEVNPQNAGEAYTLFSGGFNLIEVQVTLGSSGITTPQIHVVGKIEEYLITRR
jgi:hypothetical protein